MANISALLGIVQAIASNANFQQSAIGLLQGLGMQLAGKISDPNAQHIVSNLINNAPQLVGAMVKGTRAEVLVDPVFVPSHVDVAALKSGFPTGPLTKLIANPNRQLPGRQE